MRSRHNLTGLHSKPANQLMTYFPLDESNGTPYFTDVHQGSTQGFITVFCGVGLAVGVPEAAVGSTGPLAGWSSGGVILLYGLREGKHSVGITDAAGQLIWEGAVFSSGRLPTRLGSLDLAAGLYLVRIQDVGVVKLISQ